MELQTRNRIAEMDASTRHEYAAVLELDLRRARAKRERVAHDIECTRDPVQLGHKQRRLRGLDRQIASLSGILRYIERFWPRGDRRSWGLPAEG